MPSVKDLERKLEETVKKSVADLKALEKQYNQEFENVKRCLANCESEQVAQKIILDFQSLRVQILTKMNEVKSKSEAEAVRITAEIAKQKQLERQQEEQRQQQNAEAEEQRRKVEAEREAAELERKRKEQEEESRRKIEEMKERMRNDEEYVRKYIINLRINGFGAGVAVYDGDKIIGAAADASLGPIANARYTFKLNQIHFFYCGVGMVATVTDESDEKAIEYNLAKVGLLDNNIKASAGVKVGVKDEGPAAGSAYVNLAKVDVCNGAIGADAGLKCTTGFKDSTGRTGLIAETNVANANVGPVQASVGLAATTAFKADNDGVSAEVLGTGFSVGNNVFKVKFFGSSIGFGW